eukprot:3312645-Rhodomonas_salina.1
MACEHVGQRVVIEIGVCENGLWCVTPGMVAQIYADLAAAVVQEVRPRTRSNLRAVLAARACPVLTSGMAVPG